MKLVTGAAMRAVDHEAIQTYGIPGVVLMENAGRAVADEILKMVDRPSNAVILCGRGNNGGDGYVVARALIQAGWQVQVFRLGEAEPSQGDSYLHFCILSKLNIPCITLTLEPLQGFLHLERALAESDFIVDAMLGTGLTGEVNQLHRAVFEKIQSCSHSRIVAIDLPSGINSDTGAVMGSAVQAEMTVALAALKLGNVLYPGFSYGGKLKIRDIGIPDQAYNASDVFARWIQDADVEGLLPKRCANSHKGTYGKVCLIAGQGGMGGAAVLAAKAVLRTGAGLVRLFSDASIKDSLLSVLPEAIVQIWDEGTSKQNMAYCAAAEVTAIGPGCGQSPFVSQILMALLTELNKPLVIDADGLNALAQPELLTCLKNRKSPTLLTPHPAEMSRLTGLSVAEITADPVRVARQYAEQWGVVLVLKGARTVIADEKGQVAISSAGNSGMATAGSGDVLTGLLAALIAQGLDVGAAAVAGVHLHGRSGDVMADLKGQNGLIAGDLIEGLTDVLKHLNK